MDARYVTRGNFGNIRVTRNSCFGFRRRKTATVRRRTDAVGVRSTEIPTGLQHTRRVPGGRRDEGQDGRRVEGTEAHGHDIQGFGESEQGVHGGWSGLLAAQRYKREQ